MHSPSASPQDMRFKYALPSLSTFHPSHTPFHSRHHHHHNNTSQAHTPPHIHKETSTFHIPHQHNTTKHKSGIHKNSKSHIISFLFTPLLYIVKKSTTTTTSHHTPFSFPPSFHSSSPIPIHLTFFPPFPSPFRHPSTSQPSKQRITKKTETSNN